MVQILYNIFNLSIQDVMSLLIQGCQQEQVMERIMEDQPKVDKLGYSNNNKIVVVVVVIRIIIMVAVASCSKIKYHMMRG